jgi:repressor LexA
MLTPKQHALLILIDTHIRVTGFSPSFEEMMGSLGLHSKSGVFRLLNALEERGFVKRRRNRARALEVLRLPQDMKPATTNAFTTGAEAMRHAIAVAAANQYPSYSGVHILIRSVPIPDAGHVG